MKDKNQKIHGAIKSDNKRKIIIISAAALAILIVVVVLASINHNDPKHNSPVLKVETPPKLAIQNNRFTTVDLSISALGDTLYPAMSVVLSFDSSKLEFMGIEEGNVFVLNDEIIDGTAQALPDWSCNVQQSNKTGKINIMYLDMTGGKHAFSNNLLRDEDNVLLRLSFRLRGSADIGDVLDLVVEDAVFAASDETHSLAMTTDTLEVRNGKIVIGD